MRSPGIRIRASAWALSLAAVALAVMPGAACATRRSGDLAGQEPVVVAEIIESLWESHEGAKRAVAVEDFDEVHVYEEDVDAALHALEASVDALPDPRRQAAQETLAALFEVVDELHEGAELRDSRALDVLVVRLGFLTGQLDTVLRKPMSADPHATRRTPEHRERGTTGEVSP